MPLDMPKKLTWILPKLLRKRFGAAAVNTKGSKGWGDRSIGQDCCSISILPSGWSVFCLFDGHGDSGHWPALRASRTLPYFLQASSSCSTMLKQGKIKARSSKKVRLWPKSWGHFWKVWDDQNTVCQQYDRIIISSHNISQDMASIFGNTRPQCCTPSKRCKWTW